MTKKMRGELFSPNFILPPVFGGEIKPSTDMTKEEFEFRSIVKDAIYNFCAKNDVRASEFVVGMIPIAYEVCLECIIPEHYDEAIEAFNEVMKTYADHVAGDEIKTSVLTGYKEVNSKKKNSGLDWS